MRARIRIGFGGVIAAATLVAMSTGAAAVDDIVFDISGFATGAPGEIRLLGEIPVAAELVGATCTGDAELRNQESVHPNTDVIISTGASQAVIADVESEPFKFTTLTGSVVLGNTVRFELRFGADGITSGGITVTLDCAAAPPTTTAPPTTPAPTTPAPTTIAASAGPTTAAPTPTTAAPVVTSAVAAAAVPAALPASGSSSGPAILAATALIIAGAGMTLARRRGQT